MSFENEFVKFKFNKSNLYVNIFIKKEQPEQNEWDDFFNFFKNFYLACDEINQKFILYYDLKNLGILEKNKYDQWLQLFKDFESISLKCLICSAILTNYQPLATMINGILLFYKNTKPVKVFSLKEDADKFIIENKDINIIDLDEKLNENINLLKNNVSNKKND